MLLIDQIKQDMFEAKKLKQPTKASLLNTLWAEASRIGKDDGNRQSTDNEVVAVIKKFLKGVDEILSRTISIEALSIAKEERDILMSYLPQQLSDDELRKIIVDLNTKDKGTIMKYLKENYAGLYDGKTASEIAGNL